MKCKWTMGVSPSSLGSPQEALTMLLPSWRPDSHRSHQDSCSPGCMVVVCLPPLSYRAGKGKGGISANSSYSQSLRWDLAWLHSFHWEILGKQLLLFPLQHPVHGSLTQLPSHSQSWYSTRTEAIAAYGAQGPTGSPLAE